MAKKGLSLSIINKKLDLVLKNQQKLLREETEELKEEKEILSKEDKELTALERLERLEKEIAGAVEPHPLVKITYRDIARGSVGAFIGVMAHYTFVYGIKVAQDISLARAYMLFPLSFLMGGIFMYFTGFRKVHDAKILWFLPVRLTVLYSVAVLMALGVLLFFSPDFGQSWDVSVKQLATVTLLGVIGSITADLLGGE